MNVSWLFNRVGRGERGEGGGGCGEGIGRVGCGCEGGGDGVNLVEGEDSGEGWPLLWCHLARSPAWFIVVP